MVYIFCFVKWHNNWFWDRAIKIRCEILGIMMKKKWIVYIIILVIIVINIKPIKVVWWSHTVEVEDIEKIEIVCMPSLENERYKLIDSNHYEDYIDKLHGIYGIYSIYERSLNGISTTYYFTMKDGSRHKIFCDDKKIWVDNMPFITVQHVLKQWPSENGNSILPENFSY